jgi:hypothetical protein
MRYDSVLLMVAGGAGGLFGLAALVTGVHGVAAVLCALVFAIAAACLYMGWRFWTASPLVRFRQRQGLPLPLRRP